MDRMSDLIAKAIERLEQCECDTDEGCFKCVANPLSNESASKQATHLMLLRLNQELACIPRKSCTEEESITHEEPELHSCPYCKSLVGKGVKFCSECGKKLEM